MKVEAIAVLKLWAVEQPSSCTIRYRVMRIEDIEELIRIDEIAVLVSPVEYSISIRLKNGEKIMNAVTMAVMQLWAVDKSPSCTVRYNQFETPCNWVVDINKV